MGRICKSGVIAADLTYDGRPVIIVRVGIFLTLIEYRDLFKNVSRMRTPGNITCRQFRVLTSALDRENNTCLVIDHK